MTSALLPDRDHDGRLVLVGKEDRDPASDPDSSDSPDSEGRSSGQELVPVSRLPKFLRRDRRAPANSLRLTFPDGAEQVVTYEVAEQMRLLMVRAKLDSDLQCVALTSAVSGEGSSFIARSLGAVIAHDSDLSVCLVEFNWDEADESEKVTEIPVDGIVEDGVDETGRNFTIITSGYVAPLQRSLFVSSESLGEDIASVRDFFDVVILDLPSVVSHSGVLALSEYADRYVLVSQQGSVPAGQIKAAIDDLGEEQLAGVVLNKVSFDAPNWILRLFGT